MNDWKRKLKDLPASTLERLLLGLVLGLAVVARLAQYLANRSLWLDEAYLALNVLERNLAGLLRPLDYNQIAPPIFLWTTKLLVQLWGEGEPVLRLLPLLGGLLAVGLIYVVSRKAFGKRPALLATALLGWSQQLIYFSSEFKPYATDVFAVLVAYALYLPWYEEREKRPGWGRLVALSLVGALLPWLSYPVIFVLAALGAGMLYDALRRRERGALLRVLLPPALWAGSFGLLYLLVARGAGSNPFLQAFWADFFLPFPPRSLSDLYWIPQQWFDFLVFAAGLPFYGLTTFLWLGGELALLREHREGTLLALALPLPLVLGASALRLYPFGARMILFAVPPTVLLVTYGATALFRALTREHRLIAWLCVGLLLFHPLYRSVTVLGQPWLKEEVRPIIALFAQERQPGDLLYVYHAAEPTFRYYAPRFGLDEGLPIRVGRVGQGDFSLLVEDIEALGSGRVWLLFAHVHAFKNISEQAYMVEQLEQRGVRITAHEAPGTALFLYDLR